MFNDQQLPLSNNQLNEIIDFPTNCLHTRTHELFAFTFTSIS